jgi:hypothetical protein
MKTKLIIGILGLVAVASSVLFSAEGKRTDLERRIEEIKRQHKDRCDLITAGIHAGYVACALGLDKSNYLAQTQADWDRWLAERIAEEKSH